MKKLFITLMLAVAMLPLVAQTAWTVESVPNTRLQSNYIHVSDPDGFISDEYEMKINTALSAIRNQADVFLVALGSIGSYDPMMFRNELFSNWGIGDKDKNNGLLLLFVEDQHSFEFETGYGIEPDLPDAKCFEIFQHTIKPYFKDGDYQGGMLAGVLDIVKVFGGEMPATLITDLPDEQVYKDARPEQEEDNESDFYLFVCLILGAIFPIVSGLAYLIIRRKDKKNPPQEIKDDYTVSEENGVKYLNDFKSTWSGSPWHGIGCMRSLTFGFSGLLWIILFANVINSFMPASEHLLAQQITGVLAIVAYLSWTCWRNNVRTLKMAEKVAKDSLNPKMIYKKAKDHPRTVMLNYLAYWIGRGYMKKYDKLIAESHGMLCPECRQPMTEGDEVQLNEMEAAERAHNVWKYTSLRCPAGHAYVVKERGKDYDNYSTCEKCGAHLKECIHSTVLTKATYSHSGLKELVYECEFCHNQTSQKVIIPRLERESSSGGGSSSHSSGGSFGGGRSGGGGYSGKW